MKLYLGLTSPTGAAPRERGVERRSQARKLAGFRPKGGMPCAGVARSAHSSKMRYRLHLKLEIVCCYKLDSCPSRRRFNLDDFIESVLDFGLTLLPRLQDS